MSLVLRHSLSSTALIAKILMKASTCTKHTLIGYLIMKCVKISPGRWEHDSQRSYWLVTGALLWPVIGWRACDVECFVGIDCRSCCALLDIWTTWPLFLSYIKVTFMRSQNACSMTSLDSPRISLAVSDILREQNCARWNSRMLSLQRGSVSLCGLMTRVW
jgi:hypothetical protein